jgi:hypothetical protein
VGVGGRHTPGRLLERRGPAIAWAAVGLAAALTVALVAIATRTRGAPQPRLTACPSLPVFVDGRVGSRVCVDEAARLGLTALSLSDDWLSSVFSETEDQPQPMRGRLLALAKERLLGAGQVSARRDRHFELYGLFPTFTVLGRRLLDEETHRCHDAVDDRALSDEPSPAELRALQAHLRCDGAALPPSERLDGPTTHALGRYRRRHMAPGPPRLDEELRNLLLTDSRELDFRALLRALRERVADAAGLIEDGSAAARESTVLGRALEGEEIRRGLGLAGAASSARAAPDLIAAATEAAARALGWTSPAAAQSWFAARLTSQGDRPVFLLPDQVLVRLPRPPSYHGHPMSLTAVIDRGDVWLGPPYASRPVGRRPTLTLYASDEHGQVALVRWPTTIGGWHPFEDDEGELELRYNESRVGPALWRELLAAPAWYPPPGIPVRSLLAEVGDELRPRAELIGPGYRAAYGLVALVHEERRGGDGGDELVDHGIRTHGTPSFRSIVSGTSHGCHRLYNHLALRLGAFLLRHHDYVRHGVSRQRYQRTLVWEDQELALRTDQRGYVYELVPPVPVEVLPGSVRGSRAAVSRPVPLVRGRSSENRR